MEAEINKKIMSTAYPSADFTAEVLSEGDAIVPDTKPDISEILMCEGRCSADKVEIQKVFPFSHLSKPLMYHALYIGF